MLRRLVAVVLHHLARQRRRQRVGQVVDEARVGLAQTDLPGVFVEHLQALDRRVVLERFLVAQRLAAQLRQAEQLRALEDVEVGAVGRRVVMALDRIDVVGRHQFALAAFEGRVVGEEDAGAHLQRDGAEIGRDLGQFAARRLHAEGPRQIGPAQRRVEHRGVDDVRVAVGDARRVEARLGAAKRIAQHLGLRERRRRHHQGQQPRPHNLLHAHTPRKRDSAASSRRAAQRWRASVGRGLIHLGAGKPRRAAGNDPMTPGIPGALAAGRTSTLCAPQNPAPAGFVLLATDEGAAP